MQHLHQPRQPQREHATPKAVRKHASAQAPTGLQGGVAVLSPCHQRHSKPFTPTQVVLASARAPSAQPLSPCQQQRAISFAQTPVGPASAAPCGPGMPVPNHSSHIALAQNVALRSRADLNTEAQPVGHRGQATVDQQVSMAPTQVVSSIGLPRPSPTMPGQGHRVHTSLAPTCGLQVTASFNAEQPRTDATAAPRPPLEGGEHSGVWPAKIDVGQLPIHSSSSKDEVASHRHGQGIAPHHPPGQTVVPPMLGGPNRMRAQHRESETSTDTVEQAATSYLSDLHTVAAPLTEKLRASLSVSVDVLFKIGLDAP